MSTDLTNLGPPIPLNSLSVVLLSRGDGTFHWALGLAIPLPGARFAFRKLHATQLKGPSWEFEDVVHDIAAMQARKPVCVVVQIGHTGTGAADDPAHTPDAVARLVRAIPLVLPEREVKEGEFNCRVWVREALRVLHDHGAVNVMDIEKLEDEFIALGEQNDGSVVQGGPYKVYWSENVGARGGGSGVAADV